MQTPLTWTISGFTIWNRQSGGRLLHVEMCLTNGPMQPSTTTQSTTSSSSSGEAVPTSKGSTAWVSSIWIVCVGWSSSPSRMSHRPGRGLTTLPNSNTPTLLYSEDREWMTWEIYGPTTYRPSLGNKSSSMQMQSVLKLAASTPHAWQITPSICLGDAKGNTCVWVTFTSWIWQRSSKLALQNS